MELTTLILQNISLVLEPNGIQFDSAINRNILIKYNAIYTCEKK